MVNGKDVSFVPEVNAFVALSDHIWLLYMLPQCYKDDEEDAELLKEWKANEFN